MILSAKPRFRIMLWESCPKEKMSPRKFWGKSARRFIARLMTLWNLLQIKNDHIFLEYSDKEFVKHHGKERSEN